MRARTLSWAAWATVAGALGCSQERIYHLPEGATVAFMIEVDRASGQRLSIVGQVAGKSSSVVLDQAQDLYLLVLPEAALAAVNPHVDPSRLPESELIVEPEESCSAGAVTEDRTQLDQALSMLEHRSYLAEDGVFSERAVPAAALAELSVRIPRRADACPGAGMLVPFGAAPAILDVSQPLCGKVTADRGYATFQTIATIDRDRLVAQTERAIYLFQRGQPFSDQASERVCDAQLSQIFGPSDGSFTHLVRFGAELWVLAIDSSSGRVAPVSLNIDRSGALVLGRTATIVSGVGRGLAIDQATGAVIAVGRRGLVLTASSVDARYSVQHLPNVDLEEVVFTGLPGKPHLVSTTTGAVLVGNLGAPVPRYTITTLAPGDPTPVTALAVQTTSSGINLWAAHSGDLFLSRDGVHWERRSIEFPDQDQSCARRVECGRYLDFAGFTRLLAEGESLFVCARQCTPVIVFRPANGCAASLERDVRLEFPAPFDLKAIDLHQGILTVGGSAAILYQRK